jgi:hypothetical protein
MRVNNLLTRHLAPLRESALHRSFSSASLDFLTLTFIALNFSHLTPKLHLYLFFSSERSAPILFFLAQQSSSLLVNFGKKIFFFTFSHLPTADEILFLPHSCEHHPLRYATHSRLRTQNGYSHLIRVEKFSYFLQIHSRQKPRVDQKFSSFENNFNLVSRQFYR